MLILHAHQYIRMPLSGRGRWSGKEGGPWCWQGLASVLAAWPSEASSPRVTECQQLPRRGSHEAAESGIGPGLPTSRAALPAHLPPGPCIAWGSLSLGEGQARMPEALRGRGWGEVPSHINDCSGILVLASASEGTQPETPPSPRGRTQCQAPCIRGVIYPPAPLRHSQPCPPVQNRSRPPVHTATKQQAGPQKAARWLLSPPPPRLCP